MDISTGMNSADAALGQAALAEAESSAQIGAAETSRPQAASRKDSPILGGPSLVVKDKATAEAFQAMAESTYETKKTIIGNMVDTPEERAEKAAREAERKAKELDVKERNEEQIEKTVQNNRILDEIAANRVITDRP